LTPRILSFYCKRTFLPTKIKGWCDKNASNGPTALCPKCGIDSVIGKSIGSGLEL
jgi:hypothetical protein